MRSTVFRTIHSLLFVVVLVSCRSSEADLPIRPSQKIGPMWVNRYGHTNSEFIWNHCADSMTETPGIQETECTVPKVDELFIGYGIRGVDEDQRDSLWEARSWELYIDDHPVDLPAFNIADFDAEQEGKTYYYRLWRIRLRKIPDGVHTLRYIMNVNQEIEGDPDSKPVGTYELLVKFRFNK